MSSELLSFRPLPFLCFSPNGELPSLMTSGLSITSAQTGRAHWPADAVHPSGIQYAVFGTSRLKSMLCAVSTVRLSVTGTRSVRDQVRTGLLNHTAKTTRVSKHLSRGNRRLGQALIPRIVLQCLNASIHEPFRPCGCRDRSKLTRSNLYVLNVLAATGYSRN